MLIEKFKPYSPATGGTINMENFDNQMIVRLDPATDIASLTLNWPVAPRENQRVIVLSTRNIGMIAHTGATLNKTVRSMAAGSAFSYFYDAPNAAWMIEFNNSYSSIIASFNGTTVAGSSTIYLTDNGLSTGNPIFASIDDVVVSVNDSAALYGRGWSVTNSNKNLNVTITKQTFTGITVVGINVLGSVTMTAAAVAYKATVFGKLA